MPATPANSNEDGQPHHVVKKRTIIKDRVGCVRTTTYDLPAENFTYGIKTQQAPEGAGAIISNWVTANPSLEKKSSKMVVASNVLAIKRGCITAKSMRQYAIDHPNIRMKEILVQDSTRVDANHEGPFGIKTKFADEGMDQILQAQYTDFSAEDTDYPSVVTIKDKGYLPEPKPTIASQALLQSRKKAAEDRERKEGHRFIMKRFQNIKGSFEREREEAAAAASSAEERRS